MLFRLFLTWRRNKATRRAHLSQGLLQQMGMAEIARGRPLSRRERKRLRKQAKKARF